MAKDPVIDVHAHAVLASTLGAAGTAGPEAGADPDGTPWYRVGEYRLRGVRYAGTVFMDPQLRVAAMAEAGIDVQLLSPNPLTYFHGASPEQAIGFCRRHNDDLAAVADRYPGKLYAAAALPMQDVPRAAQEARRAVRELGMRAVYVGTDTYGAPLDHPKFDELYASVVELDVPLFLHPGPPGIDRGMPDIRWRSKDLDLLVGFAAEETLAVATLVLSDVLDRHPKLDVCVSHGGGAFAFLLGRFEAAARTRPWASSALRAEGAAARVRRLWFDTHVHSPASLALLREVAGDEHLVFGTNFGGWDSAVAGPPDPGLLQLTAGHAAKLLRLTPPEPPCHR